MNDTPVIEELKAATKVTSAAIEFWDKLSAEEREVDPYRTLAHKAASNIVYFLAKLKKLGGADANALRVALAKLETIPISQYYDLFKSIDCKIHGLVALDEAAKAMELAKQNYTQLKAHAEARAARVLEFQEIGHYLDADERGNFKTAVNVMFSEGRDWD